MPYHFLDSSILGHALDRAEQPYQIIGGGIAGLMLGFFLKKQGISFQIYEASHQVGGILQTKYTKYGLAESAANGVLWTPAFQEMVQDLGLTFLTPKKVTKNRYLVRQNELVRFPFSFGETMVLFKNFLRSQKNKKITTIREFSDAYFSRTMSRQVLEPALGGIYAAQLHELSFPAVLPQLAKLQAKGGSLGFQSLKSFWTRKKNKPVRPKHLGGTLSFAGGMQTLVEALTDYLSKHITLNTNGLALNYSQKPTILCAPAYQAATFFEGHELSHLLESVNYSPIISATLFFDQSAFNNFKPGFGCLIPRNEGYNLLGILFNHCIFEGRTTQPNVASLTCIARDFNGQLFTRNNNQIIQLFVEEINRLFDIKSSHNLLHYQLHRWPKGIPLYSPQLYDNWSRINDLLKKDFPNIRLFGNYTGQISIRGMCEMAKQWVG